MRLWYLPLFVLSCLVFCHGGHIKGSVSKQHKVTLLKFFKLNGNPAASKETVKNITSSAKETNDCKKMEKLLHSPRKCEPSTGVPKGKQPLKLAKNRTKEVKKSFRPYDDDDDDDYRRYPEDEKFSDDNTGRFRSAYDEASERSRDYEIGDDDEEPLKHRQSYEEEAAPYGKHGRVDDEFVDGSFDSGHHGRGEKWWDSTRSSYNDDEDGDEEPSLSHHKFHPRLSSHSSYSYNDDAYDEPSFTRPKFHPKFSSHSDYNSDDDTYEDPSFTRPRFHPRISSHSGYFDDRDSYDEPNFSRHRFRPRFSNHGGFSNDEEDSYDEPSASFSRPRFHPRISFNYNHRRPYARTSMLNGYKKYGQATHVWPSSHRGYQRSSLMPLPAHAPYGFHPMMQQAWWQSPYYPPSSFPSHLMDAQLVRPGTMGNYRRNMFSIPHAPSNAFFIPPRRNFSPSYPNANLPTSLGVETFGTLPGIESTFNKFSHLFHPGSVLHARHPASAGQFFPNLPRPHHEFPDAVLNSLRDLNLQRRSIMHLVDCYKACMY